jgi:hypothetical protein
MDRITDVRSPRVSRVVGPIDHLSPSKPLQSGEGRKLIQAPYGVVDRVTLSPEGRAMALQQRVTQPVDAPQQALTYGPGRQQSPPAPRLPYTPDS